MTATKRRKKTVTAHESTFVKVAEWDGLTKGAEFRVAGLDGWFSFINYVTNPRNNDSWVDASHSGGRHKGMLRSFRPERIVRTATGEVRLRGMRGQGSMGERRGRGQGWYVVTLEAGAEAYAVVFEAPTKKPCRLHVNQLASPSRLRRSVSEAGVVELTPVSGDHSPWYLGTAESLAKDGLMEAPDPGEDDDWDDEDDDSEDLTDTEDDI